MLERNKSPFHQKRKEALGDLLSAGHVDDEDIDIVKSLKGPLANIFDQLRPEIEKGEYRLVIGDDASGRIPAFIVGHALKKIYRKQGVDAPSVRFIAGSTGVREDEALDKKIALVKEQIAKIKETLAKGNADVDKVLIVTDTVATGRSVAVILKALKENGWKGDVATVTYASDELSREGFEKSWGTRVIFADTKGHPVYANRALSGVTKDPGEIFAQSVNAPDDEIANDKVRAARAVAEVVADGIARDFLKTTSG